MGLAKEEAGSQQVALQTAYLQQELEGAHQISITGTLNGTGTLILDPNTCGLNEFGDTTICTKIAPQSFEVKLVAVKIGDPTGAGRHLYEIVGAKLASRLFLVVPPKSGTVFRMVSQDRSGATRAITLEQPAGPAAANGGKPSVALEKGEELGVAKYKAEQVPGAVIITAAGETPTPGYKVFFRQLPIDIFPPQFALIWKKPDKPVAQVLTPFQVRAKFRAEDKIDEVVVHDAKGRHVIPVEQVPDVGSDNSGGGGKGQIVTGTSQAFSFDKAFADAASKLKAPHPDALFELKVLEISGRQGGIAGLTELTVKVKATTD